MHKVKISDTNLHKLLERCQDLEKRGYECTSRIKKVEQVYHQVRKDKDLHRAGSISMGVSQRYMAIYEKVKTYA